MNDQQLEEKMREAMTAHITIVADQIETAMGYCDALTGIDPVLLGAGGNDQTWAHVLQMRALVAPWFNAAYAARMTAEAARDHLRQNGGSHGDPA